MNEEVAFLDGIKANPQDLVLRSVYADWLEERGDARSEYLRIDRKLQELLGSLATNESADNLKIRQLGARLKKLGKTLDANWIAIIDALRPKFFRCSACRKVISAKEAIDTNPRGYRKMKNSRYCKLCYEDAVRWQMRRGYDYSGSRGSTEHEYHDGASDDD